MASVRPNRLTAAVIGLMLMTLEGSSSRVVGVKQRISDSAVSRVRRHVTSVDLTLQQKKSCQSELNNLRRKANASNMNKLYWNEDLAVISQRIATSCNVKTTYDSKASVVGLSFHYSDKKFSVNESIHEMSTQAEFINMTVWHGAKEFGCGKHFCREVSELDKVKNGTLFICTISPVTGHLTEPPYRAKGAPCTDCSHLTCQDGLCNWKVPASGGCETCVVSKYNCTQCASGYSDPKLFDVCATSGRHNITVEPRYGLIESEVPISLSLPSEFGINNGQRATIRFVSSTGKDLRLDVTFKSYGNRVNFTAKPLQAEMEGVAWNISIILDKNRVCDLNRTITFYRQPRVEEVTPRKTIISGGTRVTIKGTNLFLVSMCHIRIHLTFTDTPDSPENSTAQGNCTIRDNEFICITPKISIDESTIPQSVGNKPINGDRIYSDVEVLLDGAAATSSNDSQDQDCPGFCIYKNPSIQPWDPQEQEYSQIISIKGRRLAVIDRDNYYIKVGTSAHCEIQELTNTMLTCRAPPNSATRESTGRHPVEVRVGHLRFNVGSLLYSEATINWPLILGCAGGGLLLLLIILFSSYYGCRDRPQPEQPASLQGMSNQAVDPGGYEELLEQPARPQKRSNPAADPGGYEELPEQPARPPRRSNPAADPGGYEELSEQPARPPRRSNPAADPGGYEELTEQPTRPPRRSNPAADTGGYEEIPEQPALPTGRSYQTTGGKLPNNTSKEGGYEVLHDSPSRPSKRE